MNTTDKTAKTASAQPENRAKIIDAYLRDYSDNGQTVAYVEWSNGARTEGNVNHAYMQALFRRAEREGIKIRREKC